MRNIKLILEYDGTRYHGWQHQDNGITIQQVLEESIGKVTQEIIRVIGSGRTDAGVHAMNQVVNFITDSQIAERNLLKGINSILPRDIVVKSLMEVDPGFHARYDAKGKVYLYQIFNGNERAALYRHYAWFVRSVLDVDRMRQGANMFVGTHDFSSFCGSNCGISNHVRTVNNIEMNQDNEGMLRVYIEADGFLKYMVRNMVGTLVEIGMGKRFPDELATIMEAKDRKRAGITAPAHGLFLKEVRY
jgi:tRNA pseudouridine38-40 synthase